MRNLQNSLPGLKDIEPGEALGEVAKLVYALTFRYIQNAKECRSFEPIFGRDFGSWANIAFAGVCRV